MRDNAPLIKCQCSPDCKTMICSITNTGKPKTHAKGHESIGIKRHLLKGYTIDKKGYILDYRPYHPFANHLGYVRDHRLVYEHYLYIMFDEPVYIPLSIDIHHENGNVQDNCLINLTPLDRTKHSIITSKNREYKIIDTSGRSCNLCGGYETATRKGKQRRGKSKRWHLDINGYLCHWCYEVITDCRKKFRLPTSGY